MAAGLSIRVTSQSTVAAEPALIIRAVDESSLRLFCGSSPTTPADFERLRNRGVTQILCVDGLSPDARVAAAFGIRVIHRPIGYAAVSIDDQRFFAALGRDLRGSSTRWFVHCHHGRHRGPAAAAMVAMAAGWMDADQSERWLDRAGTSPRYADLRRSVRSFDPDAFEDFDPIDALIKQPPKRSAEVRRMLTMRAAIDALGRGNSADPSTRAIGGVTGTNDPGTNDRDEDHAWLMLDQAIAESIRMEMESPDQRDLWRALQSDVRRRSDIGSIRQHCDRCHHRHR